MELRVDLQNFQGPLDLLLHLVQQEEVDIYEIPVARIADKFLAAVRGQIHDLDVDHAGEYLVLASQLLVLKSRALLPRETPVDLEEIDPRLDLVRQLIEYRDFKRVAGVLGARAGDQSARSPVVVKGPGRRRPDEEELEVDLFALVTAFQRLLRETGADTTVAMPRERLPITFFVEVMFDRLIDGGGEVSFTDLLAGSRDRTYVIGAFLALLELIKLRKILVMQDGLGEIQIQIREEGMELEDAVDRDLASQTIDRPEMGESQRVRIVFMGSPAFAVPLLQSLVGAGLSPILVVTPPPKPAGRGRRKREVPLAEAAERLQLPLHRTGDVNGRTSREAIEETTPDVIVTAGFGQKLGGALLTLPPKGCVNVHASLLPRYRGASPVTAAVRDGVDKTGVTLFLMDEEWDEGPIIAQAELPLTGDETKTAVTQALAGIGADLLVRTLPSYVAGEIEPVEQDNENANYAARLKKEEGRVPWAENALSVKNHVRAMTEWPGAQTAWQPKVKHDPLPIVLAQVAVLEQGDAVDGADRPPPGTVLAAGPEGIDIACGEGAVRVERLRPAGKRDMSVKDFLNGRRVVRGDRFL